MIDNYDRARGYACKLLRGVDYIDLVHDAYLAYYTKKHKNLFEEPLWLVLKVMRDSGVNFFRKKEGRGKYKYAYRPIEEYDLISNELFDKVAADQMLSCLSSRVTPAEQQTLQLRLEGFTAKEIGEQLSIGRTGIDYRLNRIKSTAKKLWT